MDLLSRIDVNRKNSNNFEIVDNIYAPGLELTGGLNPVQWSATLEKVENILLVTRGRSTGGVPKSPSGEASASTHTSS